MHLYILAYTAGDNYNIGVCCVYIQTYSWGHSHTEPTKKNMTNYYNVFTQNIKYSLGCEP